MTHFRLIERIPPVLRNKYLLASLLFVLWILFFDSNNLIARYRELRNLNKLRADMEYYRNRIEEDNRKLHELRMDSRNLEKYAREQYRMKKADEDLYIIVTPSEDRKLSRKSY
jgi:cell division protein FtsB